MNASRTITSAFGGLSRDVAMTLAGRLIAMIGPIGVSIITARMLGPDDRGRYFFVISIAQIAVQISTLGLASSNTYLAAGRPAIASRLAVNSLVVSLLVTPIVALLIILAIRSPELLRMTNNAGAPFPTEILLAIALAPFLLLFMYFTNLLIAIGRVLIFNGLLVFSSVTALTAAVIVALLGGGMQDYLIAAAVAALIGSVAAGLVLLRGKYESARFDWMLFREGILYALRAYLATLFGFLLMRIGVIALEQRSTFGEIGQLSVAMQIMDAMILFPSTVGLLLFPDLVRTSQADRWDVMLRTLRQIGALMVWFAVLVVMLAPFAVPLVFGSDYSAAAPLTIAMAPAVLIVTGTTVVSQYLSAEGFPKAQVVAWGIGFAVQAALSFGLAAKMGAYAVALALTVSNATVLLLLTREALRIRRQNLSSSASLKFAKSSGPPG